MANKQILFYTLIVSLLVVLTSCRQSANHTNDAPKGIFEVQIVQADQVEESQQVINEIMPVLEAFFWGTVDDRRSIVHYLNTPCTTTDGLGGPPKCSPTEAQGTLIQVFPVSEAEGHFVRPEEIDRTLEFNIDELYAVYRPTPGVDSEKYWPTGEYALLFDRKIFNTSVPVTAFIQDGKLVRLSFSYPVDPAQILSAIPLDQILISPEDAKELTEQVKRVR